MANEEHLAIIKQGVEVWNVWREDNPGVAPDLFGADLSNASLNNANLRQGNISDANLKDADLSRADLTRAQIFDSNLSGVILSGASLFEANLSKSVLSRADLSYANLNGAILEGTRLDHANLKGASLGGTNLIGVYLSGANLRSAILADTVFGNIDLRTVNGLEYIRHLGSSIIGIDTIYRSAGDIPEVFLRGAGVPDQFIAYIRSSVGTANEYYTAFISYSSKDDALAKRIHNDLQSENVRCWFAPEDMKIGDKFRQRIYDAILLHDKLLLILSENSIESDWVEKEVETAFEKERWHKHTVLFPIRLDNAVMETNQAWAADLRRTRHIGDFRNWKEHDAYQTSFQRLLRDLKRADEESS